MYKHTTTPTIPSSIVGHRFMQVIQHESNSSTHVALYQDEHGHKVVAKIWQGKYKNYSYYSLLHEYRVYSVLTQAASRLNHRSIRAPLVEIPQLIGFYETRAYSALLIDWVDGQVSTQLSDQALLRVYLRVNEYLDLLSRELRPSERQQLTTRPGYFYLLLYPLTLCIALIKNLRSTPDLLAGLKRVIEDIPRLLKPSALTLVHRDLNFENILTKGKHIYLIDFQFSVLTYKVCEFVNTLRYCYDKNRLKKSLYTAVMERYAKDQSVASLFPVMIILFATHGLIAGNFSAHVIGAIKKYLRFGLRLETT